MALTVAARHCVPKAPVCLHKATPLIAERSDSNALQLYLYVRKS